MKFDTFVHSQARGGGQPLSGSPQKVKLFMSSFFDRFSCRRYEIHLPRYACSFPRSLVHHSTQPGLHLFKRCRFGPVKSVQKFSTIYDLSLFSSPTLSHRRRAAPVGLTTHKRNNQTTAPRTSTLTGLWSWWALLAHLNHRPSVVVMVGASDNNDKYELLSFDYELSSLWRARERPRSSGEKWVYFFLSRFQFLNQLKWIQFRRFNFSTWQMPPPRRGLVGFWRQCEGESNETKNNRIEKNELWNINEWYGRPSESSRLKHLSFNCFYIDLGSIQNNGLFSVREDDVRKRRWSN